MSRIYQPGPWDDLRANEPEIMVRFEDLEEALPTGDQLAITRLRVELAQEILWAIERAYEEGIDGDEEEEFDSDRPGREAKPSG